MRLLNTGTYQLHAFLGKETPAYAILSHTWDDEEILFDDLKSNVQSDWNKKRALQKSAKLASLP